jgi:hypothetical protein
MVWDLISTHLSGLRGGRLLTAQEVAIHQSDRFMTWSSSVSKTIINNMIVVGNGLCFHYYYALDG